MYEQVATKNNEKRAILYCRSAKGDYAELQRQNQVLDEYVKSNGLTAIRTYLESGTMDALTYKSFRLQAKYHEFDILLVAELKMLGNCAMEITEEVNYLACNGVKVVSIKDGELNFETLPAMFREMFRLAKINC